jgi:hypothetical protein
MIKRLWKISVSPVPLLSQGSSFSDHCKGLLKRFLATAFLMLIVTVTAIVLMYAVHVAQKLGI